MAEPRIRPLKLKGLNLIFLEVKYFSSIFCWVSLSASVKPKLKLVIGKQ